MHIKAPDLIALFERMYAEHWAYEWGAAKEGCVDCSGAFVWAFKQFGQSIYHGSNTIARKYVSGKLLKAGEAKPGWAVFKQRFDGEEPAQYRSDGLGNFYHIGLLAADGVSVLNAKGEKYGFSSDPLSKWQYAAPLKGVEYEEVKPELSILLYQAIVTTAKDPLRVRETPSTGKILGHVPKGATVDVLEAGEWPRIRYNELTGYVSGAYLTPVDGSAVGTDAPANGDTVTIPRALAEQLYRALGEQLGVD